MNSTPIHQNQMKHSQLNVKVNTMSNELKLLYRKNDSLTNELSEKDKLFGEKLGKNETNMKLLEKYKNNLNSLKKENIELNKNNILVNKLFFSFSINSYLFSYFFISFSGKIFNNTFYKSADGTTVFNLIDRNKERIITKNK